MSNHDSIRRRPSTKPRVNGWTCERCGETTYAVDVDEGVTPFYLTCRAGLTCDGQAKSMMYPPGAVPDYVLAVVEWEWYRPPLAWARRQGPGMLHHVEQGGLAIRELTDAGRAVLDQYGTPSTAREDADG